MAGLTTMPRAPRLTLSSPAMAAWGRQFGPADVLGLAALLALACGQWTIGGHRSATGELSGLPVPLATLALGLGALWLWRRQRSSLRLPALPWANVLFVAAAALGLLGLAGAAWPAALKELVQFGEIFGLAWLLFAALRPERLPALVNAVGAVAGGLLALALLRRGGWHGFGLSDARLGALLVIGTPFLLVAARRRSLRTQRLLAWLGALTVGTTFANGGLLLAWLLTSVFTAWRLTPRLLRYWWGPAWAVVLLGLLVPRPAGMPLDTLLPYYDATHPRRLFAEYQASLLAPGCYPLGAGLGQYKHAINVLRQELPAQPHPDDLKVPADSNAQYLVTLVESGVLATAALVLLLLVAFGRSWRASRVAMPGAPEREPYIAVNGAVLGLALAALFCTVLGRGVGIWAGAVLGLAGAALPAPAAGTRLAHYLNRLTLPVALALLGLLLLATRNRAGDPVTGVSAVNHQVREWLWPGRWPAPAAGLAADATRTPAGVTIVPLAPPAAGGQTVRGEAEAFVSVTGNLRAVQANDCSGNRALDIPNDTGKGYGVAKYELTLPETGDYELRARVFWEDGCSNSVAFAVDGVEVTLVSELFTTWHVLAARQRFHLVGGLHRVELRNLEDGIKVDYFELVYCP